MSAPQNSIDFHEHLTRLQHCQQRVLRRVIEANNALSRLPSQVSAASYNELIREMEVETSALMAATSDIVEWMGFHDDLRQG